MAKFIQELVSDSCGVRNPIGTVSNILEKGSAIRQPPQSPPMPDIYGPEELSNTDPEKELGGKHKRKRDSLSEGLESSEGPQRSIELPVLYDNHFQGGGQSDSAKKSMHDQETQARNQSRAWAKEFLGSKSPVTIQKNVKDDIQVTGKAWREAEKLSQGTAPSQESDTGPTGLKVEEVRTAQSEAQDKTSVKESSKGLSVKKQEGLEEDGELIERGGPEDSELSPKSKIAAMKQLIVAQSFDDEIRNDQTVTLEYLNRAASDPLEIAGIELYKRALTIIGSGNMQVIKDYMTKYASDNLMPTSSYLSHGARVLVRIPESSDDSLFNWLTSGDKRINGTSAQKTQDAATQEGRYVYNRYAATHGVTIKDGFVCEDKGFLLGAQSYACSMGSEWTSFALSATGLKSLVDYVHDFDSSARTNHYGIDLTLGVDGNGYDKLGHHVERVDGEHGHFYIYYQKATASAPGAILFGVEGSSPDSPHHSKSGASDPYSPTYGSLWEDLAKKEKGNFSRCIIGDKYNGRKITLTQEVLDGIVKIDVSKVDNAKLVSSIPSNSIESFLENNMQDLPPAGIGSGVGDHHHQVVAESGIPSVSSSSSSSLTHPESTKVVASAQPSKSGDGVGFTDKLGGIRTDLSYPDGHSGPGRGHGDGHSSGASLGNGSGVVPPVTASFSTESQPSKVPVNVTGQLDGTTPLAINLNRSSNPGGDTGLGGGSGHGNGSDSGGNGDSPNNIVLKEEVAGPEPVPSDPSPAVLSSNDNPGFNITLILSVLAALACVYKYATSTEKQSDNYGSESDDVENGKVSEIGVVKLVDPVH